MNANISLKLDTQHVFHQDLGDHKLTQEQMQELKPRVSKILQEIADELGLLGKRVFFDDEWCPQEEKDLWLQDADVAVVAGRDNYESELACRVRSLDFIDHGLPLVNSGGDYIGELLVRYGLASVFTPGDVPGLARILADLSRDERLKLRIRRRLAKFKREFAWERCLEPLGAWLDDKFARETEGSESGQTP